MRKAFRHTGVLMMIAVVALGLIGAAYALWFEDLQLTANVSTGTLNADVSIHDISGSPSDADMGLPVVDDSLPPAPSANAGAQPYADYGLFPAGKPKTTCGGLIGTYGANLINANDTVDNNLLTLTLGGLYPYAGCEYQIDIHNSGTVPFHIGITGVTLNKCDAIIAGVCVNPQSQLAAPWSILLDPLQASLPQCQAFLGAITSWANVPHQVNTNNDPLTPVQIHSADELLCNFKLILDQANVEGQFFQFQATYKAYQWNENPF